MLAERLAAQMLSGPPGRDAVDVARRLLAVQAQDPRGARLAVRARTAGTTAADFDRALGEDRSLVVGWLNRGTLHLVCSEDFLWLHRLTAPQQLTGIRRRLAQEGVSAGDAARAVAAIERGLAEEGPLTRARLRERVASAGVRTEGQALIHLIALASSAGTIVRGPVVGREQAYVLVRDWLGDQPECDRDRSLAELARRYLAGHAPASDRDLARWAGIPLRDARAGLAAIGRDLHVREDGLVELAHTPPAGGLPPPRLLGPFEPCLLGWESRELVLGPHVGRVTVGGIFRGFAMVEGCAAGTWSMASGKPALEPFAPLAPTVAAALAADAEDVVRFFTSPAGPAIAARRR